MPFLTPSTFIWALDWHRALLWLDLNPPASCSKGWCTNDFTNWALTKPQVYVQIVILLLLFRACEQLWLTCSRHEELNVFRFIFCEYSKSRQVARGKELSGSAVDKYMFLKVTQVKCMFRQMY